MDVVLAPDRCCCFLLDGASGNQGLERSKLDGTAADLARLIDMILAIYGITPSKLGAHIFSDSPHSWLSDIPLESTIDI